MNMPTPYQLLPELQPSVRLHCRKNTGIPLKIVGDRYKITIVDNVIGDNLIGDYVIGDNVIGDNLIGDYVVGDNLISWRCTSLCAFLFSVIWLLASAPKSSNIPWISSSSSPMLIHPISNFSTHNEHTIIEKIWVVSSGTLYFRGIPRPPASLGRGSPQH